MSDYRCRELNLFVDQLENARLDLVQTTRIGDGLKEFAQLFEQAIVGFDQVAEVLVDPLPDDVQHSEFDRLNVFFSEFLQLLFGVEMGRGGLRDVVAVDEQIEQLQRRAVRFVGHEKRFDKARMEKLMVREILDEFLERGTADGERRGGFIVRVVVNENIRGRIRFGESAR